MKHYKIKITVVDTETQKELSTSMDSYTLEKLRSIISEPLQKTYNTLVEMLQEQELV